MLKLDLATVLEVLRLCDGGIFETASSAREGAERLDCIGHDFPFLAASQLIPFYLARLMFFVLGILWLLEVLGMTSCTSS